MSNSKDQFDAALQQISSPVIEGNHENEMHAKNKMLLTGHSIMEQSEVDLTDMLISHYSKQQSFGQEKYFLEIENWLKQSSQPNKNAPLIIEGIQGIGKKALLVKWLEYHAKINTKTMKDILVHHFANAGVNFTNYFYGIYRILMKLREVFNISQKVELVEEKLRKYFSYWLDICNKKIEELMVKDLYIIIIFEGVNYFRDPSTGKEVNVSLWLPKVLPEHIKFIISLDSGSEAHDHFLQNNYNILHIENEQGIQNMLLERHLQLQIQIKEDTKSKLIALLKLLIEQNKVTPLYVKVFSQIFLPTLTVQEDLNLEFSQVPNSNFIMQVLDRLDFLMLEQITSIEKLFVYILDYFENNLIPQKIFQNVLVCLALTLKGLSFSEMQLYSKIKTDQFSILHYFFKKLLINYNGYWSLNHEALKRVIQQKYLKTSQNILKAHEMLASTIEQSETSIRKFEEVTFQLCQAKQSFKLKEKISNIENFLLLFNPNNKYDLCKYWATLIEIGFDPAMEYNKSIEGFVMHYHPEPSDIFNVLIQVNRFLKEFSDFETFKIPRFRHPPILGNKDCRELEQIGLEREIKVLDLFQELNINKAGAYPQILNDIERLNVDTPFNRELMRQHFYRQMLFQDGGSQQNINITDNLSMQEQARNFLHNQQMHASQLQPNLQYNAEQKQSNMLELMGLDKDIEKDESDEKTIQNIKKSLQDIKRDILEMESQNNKIVLLQYSQAAQSNQSQNSNEFSQSSFYYYKRFLWMNFPWICLSKENYSEVIQKCFSSATEYMNVEEEREIRRIALRIVISAKDKAFVKKTHPQISSAVIRGDTEQQQQQKLVKVHKMPSKNLIASKQAKNTVTATARSLSPPSKNVNAKNGKLQTATLPTLPNKKQFHQQQYGNMLHSARVRSISPYQRKSPRPKEVNLKENINNKKKKAFKKGWVTSTVQNADIVEEREDSSLMLSSLMKRTDPVHAQQNAQNSKMMNNTNPSNTIPSSTSNMAVSNKSMPVVLGLTAKSSEKHPNTAMQPVKKIQSDQFIEENELLNMKMKKKHGSPSKSKMKEKDKLQITIPKLSHSNKHSRRASSSHHKEQGQYVTANFFYQRQNSLPPITGNRQLQTNTQNQKSSQQQTVQFGQIEQSVIHPYPQHQQQNDSLPGIYSTMSAGGMKGSPSAFERSRIMKEKASRRMDPQFLQTVQQKQTADDVLRILPRLKSGIDYEIGIEMNLTEVQNRLLVNQYNDLHQHNWALARQVKKLYIKKEAEEHAKTGLDGQNALKKKILGLQSNVIFVKQQLENCSFQKGRIKMILKICDQNMNQNKEWVFQLNFLLQNYNKMVKWEKDHIQNKLKEIKHVYRISYDYINQYQNKLDNHLLFIAQVKSSIESKEQIQKVFASMDDTIEQNALQMYSRLNHSSVIHNTNEPIEKQLNFQESTKKGNKADSSNITSSIYTAKNIQIQLQRIEKLLNMPLLPLFSSFLQNSIFIMNENAKVTGNFEDAAIQLTTLQKQQNAKKQAQSDKEAYDSYNEPFNALVQNEAFQNFCHSKRQEKLILQTIIQRDAQLKEVTKRQKALKSKYRVVVKVAQFEQMKQHDDLNSIRETQHQQQEQKGDTNADSNTKTNQQQLQHHRFEDMSRLELIDQIHAKQDILNQNLQKNKQLHQQILNSQNMLDLLNDKLSAHATNANSMNQNQQTGINRIQHQNWKEMIEQVEQKFAILKNKMPEKDFLAFNQDSFSLMPMYAYMVRSQNMRADKLKGSLQGYHIDLSNLHQEAMSSFQDINLNCN